MATMGIHELGSKLGVTKRAIHSWVAKGLLPPPTKRGRKAGYEDAHVLRIEAILALRARRMGLAAIKRWLLSATRDQIEALVHPPAPVAPPPPQPVLSEGERWERLSLMPGLELHMIAGATPLVQRIAREIAEKYRAGQTAAAAPRV